MEKKQHGGQRVGAGRPKGSGKGRTVKKSSITLTPALWERLDVLRGQKTRSAWIAEKILKKDIDENQASE
jgi:hypothetical protein